MSLTGLLDELTALTHRALTSGGETSGMTTTHTQPHIESLLLQIRRRVGEMERLRARGVRGPALSEREQQLARVRGELAQAVSHDTPRVASKASRAA